MRSNIRSVIELGTDGQAKIALEGNVGLCRLGESVRLTVIVRDSTGMDCAVSEPVSPEKAIAIAEIFRVWANQ